jgi:long-chain acyl-CoA synthetase
MKAISHIMLFRSILDWLGFVKIKVMYVAGAASSEAFRFLLANGIDVRTLYGLAEMMPISAHQKGDFDPETSGTVVRGCTVRITEQGEVLAKGPNRMMGYYNDSENTNKAIDKKGWLHTGDAGFFNETGHLVIKDRMLDLITLDDGTVFSPIYIENKLKSCPYIKNVVIVGQGKPFAAALISIDFGNVSAWAANNHIAYATFADLSQNEEVYSLIKPYLLKTNLGLPERQRLKSFALLSEELDPRDGGLTRTLQLRRSFVLRIYADFVEALYGNGPRALTDTEVEYRDGRKAGAKTTIKIMTLEAETP